MARIADFMKALQDYPALPSNISISNMVIVADGQTTDIRNHIASSAEEKRELSEHAHTKRQRILTHSNDDGSETTVFVSKLDRKDAMRKTRFYDNPFYPLIGNALLHEMEDVVAEHAKTQVELWEQEEGARSSMDKIRNGKGGRKVGTCVNREFIKYNVITRYANGSRSQAVFTEPMDVTYEFSYMLGGNQSRIRYQQIQFKGLGAAPKCRFSKFRIKDPYGHDMTFENGRLSIDISGIDWAGDDDMTQETNVRRTDGSLFGAYGDQISDIHVRDVASIAPYTEMNYANAAYVVPTGSVQLHPSRVQEEWTPEPVAAQQAHAEDSRLQEQPIHYAHAEPAMSHYVPQEPMTSLNPAPLAAAMPAQAPAAMATSQPIHYAPTPMAEHQPASHSQNSQALPAALHLAALEQAVAEPIRAPQLAPAYELQPQGLSAPQYQDHPYDRQHEMAAPLHQEVRPQHSYAPLHQHTQSHGASGHGGDEVMAAAGAIIANGLAEKHYGDTKPRDPNYPF